MSIKAEDLERVLRRIDMNRGQTTLLKYLYEVEDEFVKVKEVIENIRWEDEDSFKGVLGAFSNRINNTRGIQGKPGYEAFIEIKKIDGDEHFRLRPEAREAIENVHELMEVFERPMHELLEGVMVEMKKPMSERLERVLELWKVVVEKNLKFEHLDLEETKYRSKRTDELVNQFLENPTKKNFLNFWSDEIIYSATRRASGKKVYEKWRAENRSMDELASFIREVKESEDYDENWEDEFPGRKSLWELFGLLNIDEHPPINNTSRAGLKFFGYSRERYYSKLEENYQDFKEKYLDIVGHASKDTPYEAPLYLEIDKLLNLVTKVDLQDLKAIEDEDARELLKNILVQRMLNNNLTDYIKKYSETYNAGKFQDKDKKWEAWKFNHADYFERNIKNRFDLMELDPDDLKKLFEIIESDDVVSNTIPAYLIGGRSGGIAWRDFKERSFENPVESSNLISKLLNEKVILEERLTEFEEFYNDIDASGGPTLGLATYFLMYTYPDRYIFYKYREFKAFFEEYLDEKISSGFNPEEYKVILGVLGEIKSELSSYIDSPDMVDVHNLIYCQGKDYLEKEDGIEKDIKQKTNYYWVNQKKEEEVEQGYLEAPTDGIWHHDLEKLDKGDIVFNYFNGEMIGCSEVLNDAKIVEVDGQEKYRVDIKINEYESPIPVNEVNDYLLKDEVKLEKHYPINKDGGINQGYLFELSEEAGDYLLNIKNRSEEKKEIKKKDKLLDIHDSNLKIENLEITKEDSESNNKLYFPKNIHDEIRISIGSALKSGKNIIFTGPPGTGKTKIAKNVAEHIKNENDCVNDFTFATATADWTTFDTIGGYHPRKDGNGLEFNAGQFLKCFKNKKGMPINKWLIIDEINRADIDKAFGQLFSVLSKDRVELPFNDDEENQISIIPLGEDDFEYKDSSYYVTKNWRLLATMNTYDKASLYEMSYAFMRRFAFIDVSVPASEELDMKELDNYIGCWDFHDIDEYILKKVLNIWKTLIDNNRAIGPAIIKDILGFVSANEGDGVLTALKLFVLPQFEGMVKTNQKNIIKALGKCGIDKDELYKVAEERFDIEFDEDE